MEQKKISSRAKAIAWIFMLIYFASYTMRINFAVMIVAVCEDMSLPKTALAVVLTAMTISYGVGQLISGRLGDLISPKLLLTGGLGLAIISNLAMYFSSSVPAMTVVWVFNGLAHAMLWPPMVALMSHTLNADEYSYVVVRVSWGSSFATIMLYTLCPLLLRVMSWKSVLLLCALFGLLTLVVWLFSAGRLFKESKRDSEKVTAEKKERRPLPKYAYFPIILIMLGIVLQGMLRDGVTNWMPSFLLESFGVSQENAIMLAVIPAIFSIFCFSLSDFVYRKLIRHETVCAAAFFTLAALASAVLFLTVRFGGSIIVSALMMALVIGCMHGVNLLLISFVPRHFTYFGIVSGLSGLVNSCTYIGSSISTYGFAALADSKGWDITILGWMIISLCGVGVCMIASRSWNRFRRSTAEAMRQSEKA